MTQCPLPPDFRMLVGDCVLCPLDEQLCYQSPCIDHGCMCQRDESDEVDWNDFDCCRLVHRRLRACVGARQARRFYLRSVNGQNRTRA